MGIDALANRDAAPAAAKRRAVFLDRDGVLNRALVRDGRPYAPVSLDEFELLPRVEDGCRALKAAGFLLIVVTNQPDVVRGVQSRESVERMNAALRAHVPVDDIRICYHDDADHCRCRKPLPGLLVEAASAWQIELSESFMVGDRWRDIEAGRRAGCRTVFIDYGYAEQRPPEPDRIVRGLPEAAEWILSVSVGGMD